MYLPMFSPLLFLLVNNINIFSLFIRQGGQKIYPSSIISIKDKRIYENNANYHETRKTILISSGGFRGFYMFGICKFIKKNYNLDPYVFSGASAGAWLSLFLSFRGNVDEFEKYLIDDSLQSIQSIHKMETTMKHKLLKKYTTDDFDLKKLYVGVTTFTPFNYANTCVFTNFENLEDAIDCCIASSHIPMVTGGLRNIYYDLYTFDGGFSKWPYLNSSKPVLHITPFFWDKNVFSKLDIEAYTTLFSRKNYDFGELVVQGYFDTFENKQYLDSVFLDDCSPNEPKC